MEVRGDSLFVVAKGPSGTHLVTVVDIGEATITQPPSQPATSKGAPLAVSLDGAWVAYLDSDLLLLWDRKGDVVYPVDSAVSPGARVTNSILAYPRTDGVHVVWLDPIATASP